MATVGSVSKAVVKVTLVCSCSGVEATTREREVGRTLADPAAVGRRAGDLSSGRDTCRGRADQQDNGSQEGCLWSCGKHSSAHHF